MVLSISVRTEIDEITVQGEARCLPLDILSRQRKPSPSRFACHLSQSERLLEISGYGLRFHLPQSNTRSMPAGATRPFGNPAKYLFAHIIEFESASLSPSGRRGCRPIQANLKFHYKTSPARSDAKSRENIRFAGDSKGAKPLWRVGILKGRPRASPLSASLVTFCAYRK